jgi:hypothetical protein
MGQVSAKKRTFREMRADRDRLVAEIAGCGFTGKALREKKSELLDVYGGLQDYYARKAEKAEAKAGEIQDTLHL